MNQNDGKFVLDGKRVKFSDYGGSSIVVDVVPIDLFTIEHMALNPAQSYPLQWVVWGHGPDDEVQLFDSFDSLDEAEKAYPNAVTVLHSS